MVQDPFYFQWQKSSHLSYLCSKPETHPSAPLLSWHLPLPRWSAIPWQSQLNLSCYDPAQKIQI